MRWSNCAVSGFSKRLRYQGEASPRRSGTKAPLISGQVLKPKPASRPATRAPARSCKNISRRIAPATHVGARERGTSRGVCSSLPRPHRSQNVSPRISTAHPEQKPKRIAEDQKRGAEMCGEAILADIGAVDQSALHHVPADCALEPAE